MKEMLSLGRQLLGTLSMICLLKLLTFLKRCNIGFSSAISGYAGIQALDQGQQIHAKSIVSGYCLDLSIGYALVCLYARCGRLRDAYLVFDKIDAKDNVSWNGLISGYAQSGHCQEALQIFAQMNQAGIAVNTFTFGSAISAATITTNIKQGKQIHAKIIKAGYNAETEASRVLITLYVKCGSLEDAKREFLDTLEKNEVSWNAIVSMYSQCSNMKDAIKVFNSLQKPAVEDGALPEYSSKSGGWDKVQSASGQNHQGSYLHKFLGIESSSQVLYVGDHIYDDILHSKKVLGRRRRCSLDRPRRVDATLLRPCGQGLLKEGVLLCANITWGSCNDDF